MVAPPYKKKGNKKGKELEPRMDTDGHGFMKEKTKTKKLRNI